MTSRPSPSRRTDQQHPSGRAAEEALLVTCDEVARTFGTGPSAVVAVHGATLQLTTTDRVAIAGPSGSGKSTLLHLIAGLEPATRGTVAWPGLPTDPHARAGQIGVVFQGPSLIPTLDVAENIALPLQLAGVDQHTLGPRVSECLEIVDAASLRHSLPQELSGGQAQRVAVARVLAQQPRLILADEPTGQLDHDTGQLVVDALLTAAEHLGAGLLVTSHDPAVTERLNLVWQMFDGRLDTGATSAAGPDAASTSDPRGTTSAPAVTAPPDASATHVGVTS